MKESNTIETFKDYCQFNADFWTTVLHLATDEPRKLEAYLKPHTSLKNGLIESPWDVRSPYSNILGNDDLPEVCPICNEVFEVCKCEVGE
jgi:hypothetical protein